LRALGPLPVEAPVAYELVPPPPEKDLAVGSYQAGME
jgi:hypothetical protein